MLISVLPVTLISSLYVVTEAALFICFTPTGLQKLLEWEVETLDSVILFTITFLEISLCESTSVWQNVMKFVSFRHTNPLSTLCIKWLASKLCCAVTSECLSVSLSIACSWHHNISLSCGDFMKQGQKYQLPTNIQESLGSLWWRINLWCCEQH